MNNAASPILSVNNLKVQFPVRQGVFGAVTSAVTAVDGVSFTIGRGEVFALVGESGCGKTTTAQAVLGLLKPDGGSIRLALGPWRDAPVSWEDLDRKEKRRMRRFMQVVFQDPYSSLDPRQTVRAILREPFAIHALIDGKNVESRIREILSSVGLAPEYLSRFPHEFSGGQRQRIGIARALATGPEFIIADEPVSALDVSIQAQIINLLADLRASHGLTLLFISHDLAVVRHVADRLAVMYRGRIMEMGTEEQIFVSPRHPYTKMLLDSVPVPGIGRRKKDATARQEEFPKAAAEGCLFAPFCSNANRDCWKETPHLKDVGGGHVVACIQEK